MATTTKNSLLLSDSFGLNKERRNYASMAKEETPNLEPEFPWDVLGFDDLFFGTVPSDDFTEEKKKG